MSFKTSRTRDLEKAQCVRFVDEPRLSTDSEIAARPRMLPPQRSWRSRLISPEAIPWLLTCIFATTTILLLSERPESRRFGSYEMGFSTDLSAFFFFFFSSKPVPSSGFPPPGGAVHPWLLGPIVTLRREKGRV